MIIKNQQDNREILNFSHRTMKKPTGKTSVVKPRNFVIKFMNNNERDAEACVEKKQFKLLVL